jgi:starch phosphorylase
MWVSGFKNVPFNEIPIGYVTNGVHLRSHISSEMEDLFLQYIGEKWVHNPGSSDLWKRIDKIPDEELWRTHEKRRERLVAFCRRRLTKQIKNRGGSMNELAAALEILDPAALTIGFARRFATYKRATLIFRDLHRLEEIVSDKDHPVQFIIAGKAHPKDEEGKRFIQEIFQFAKEERFRKRIVFIENYDLNVARYLVEGCDVWLNTPRRPLEASGTSGMKVIANGGLNFSVLDGWWDEGFDPEVGWKIGNGEEYTDPDYQDEIESHQFYDTLERQIIPLYYTRNEDKIPRQWISMVKNSMKKLGPKFNTHRMVEEYFANYYMPSFQKRTLLMEKKWDKAKELSLWENNLINNWSNINVVNVEANSLSIQYKVGENFPVKADIRLGNLTPNDVEVQIYYGPYEKQDDPQFNSNVVMNVENKKSIDGIYKYVGYVKCRETGQIGYTIRILPKNSLFIHPFELGLVYWA